jgi:DNA adenine methylase
VKWAGGKSKLLGALVPLVPKKMRTYVEPFAGGAALFFAIAREKPFKRAILCDQNEELIACYRAVKNDPAAVIRKLQRDYRYDAELFYRVREESTTGKTDIERASRFIFLNKTFFNGLWRVNSRGKFNVPFGRYDNPKILDPDALLAASAALAEAELVVGDFSRATEALGKDDFVYFDPPYDPVSSTADFTAYARGGFSMDDQRRLAKEMRRLHGLGVRVMLSNADTKKMRDLYRAFFVQRVRVPRSINSAPDKRGAVGELLVTTYKTPQKQRETSAR